MKPFKKLQSVPTPLMRDNVDTDIIIPAEFLKTVTRSGLGQGAFSSLRYDESGAPIARSVFNDPRYTDSSILLSGDNFGCGSSREHAAWALLDMGYCCIIAESFADIFASNAFKNGILTVELPRDAVSEIAVEAMAGHVIDVDLPAQEVRLPDASDKHYSFPIDPFRKECLLYGLDEVALTLKNDKSAIKAFEAKQKQDQPWLYQG